MSETGDDDWFEKALRDDGDDEETDSTDEPETDASVDDEPFDGDPSDDPDGGDAGGDPDSFGNESDEDGSFGDAGDGGDPGEDPFGGASGDGTDDVDGGPYGTEIDDTDDDPLGGTNDADGDTDDDPFGGVQGDSGNDANGDPFGGTRDDSSDDTNADPLGGARGDTGNGANGDPFGGVQGGSESDANGDRPSELSEGGGGSADPFGGVRAGDDGGSLGGGGDGSGAGGTDPFGGAQPSAGDGDDPFGEGFGAAMGGAVGGGGESEFDEEDFESDIDRLDVGIDGLDDMILGGVPVRSLMTVIGSAGTGKTTFGLQFLQRAMEEGGNGVYITLEETEDAIISTAEEKGWPFEEYVVDNKLTVVAMDPIEMANSLDSIRGDISRLVNDFGADRLVLDSVSLLEMMYDHPAKRRSEVFDFARSLKRAGVTTMLTSEANADNPYQSRHGLVEYLVDAVFVLQYVRPNDFQETRLAVEIQKIRDANHSRETKPYDITDEGISVYRQANIF